MMKRSYIDFAPRTWRRDLYRVTPLTWCVLAAAVIVLFYVAYRVQVMLIQTEVEQSILHQTKAGLQKRTANKQASPKVVIPAAQADAVNLAIVQLNLPWREMLDAIEAATPKNIALLSLEPEARKAILKGSAEAKSSDDMIAFIEQLKKQSFLSGVVLLHHEINEQDPNRPLRFQFEAHWLELAE